MHSCQNKEQWRGGALKIVNKYCNSRVCFYTVGKDEVCLGCEKKAIIKVSSSLCIFLLCTKEKEILWLPAGKKKKKTLCKGRCILLKKNPDGMPQLSPIKLVSPGGGTGHGIS